MFYLRTLRLVKRLYIPLPEGEARRRIISNLLAKERNSLTDTEVEEVVDKTEGYSGADMANLCKEAAMGPIRSLDFSDIDTMEASQVLLSLKIWYANWASLYRLQFRSGPLRLLTLCPH